MFNLEDEGQPIAYIVNEETSEKSKKPKTLFLADKKALVGNAWPFIELQDNYKFELAVNTTAARQILYVCGASGSGKSFFMKLFVNHYHKVFPKRPIYLFSALASDETLDKVKTIKRINIDENFLQETFDVTDFKDSLVLYDDVDTISDKAKKSKVMQTFNIIAELGRHENVSCAFLSHTANAGLETKKILNESTSVTFFPQTMGTRALKYLCQTTFGMSNKQIEKLRQLETRACTILKTYPMVLMSDHLTCFIRDLENIEL